MTAVEAKTHLNELWVILCEVVVMKTAVSVIADHRRPEVLS